MEKKTKVYIYPYFLRFASRNVTVVIRASISEISMEYHIPSSSKRMGKRSTPRSWYTRVLIKDSAADTGPLFRAVKNEDVNIQKPESKKESEKILKPRTVIARSSLS